MIVRPVRQASAAAKILKIFRVEHPNDNAYHRKSDGKILIDKDVIALVVAGYDDLSIQWSSKAAERNIQKDRIQAAFAQDTADATVWEDPQILLATQCLHCLEVSAPFVPSPSPSSPFSTTSRN